MPLCGSPRTENRQGDEDRASVFAGRWPLAAGRLLHVACLLPLLLLLAACGLSSEPEIAFEVPLPTPAPEITAPSQRPDLARGAAFFAEHCAECHGVGGAGDGVMVSDGRLQMPPPDLTDPATAREDTLLDYMQAVTEGNVLAGMPPFARYSEQERWDVAAYVYTGALTAEQLARGAALYEAECAACHGPGGAGDGPDAPLPVMPDFTDPAFLAVRSSADLFAAVSQGVSPEMPAFADELGEGDIWAAVAHLRAFMVAGTPGFGAAAPAGEEQAAAPAATEEVAAAPASTPETDSGASEPAATEEMAAAPAEPEIITVTGLVTNGTPGGAVPAGLTVALHGFDPPDFAERTPLETALQEDGTYTFADVPHTPGSAYFVSLQYQDVFFGSTVYTLDDPASATLETGVEIFEITDDPSVVSITAGVVRVTFSAFGMEVAEVLSFANASDRLFLTDEVINESQRVALRIPLPPGSGGVAFSPGMQGTRFFVSPDESEVIDTQPLRPGTNEVVFSYLIPYQDGAIIEQAFPYPVVGPFHVLIQQEQQVRFESEMFAARGQPVTMGESTFESYVGTLSLNPGDPIRYTLLGQPEAVAASQSTTPQGGGSPSPLVLILIVAGLLLIGAGGFMALLRRDGDSTNRAIDALVDEIARLDDQHEQGILNHDYYRRRAELKAQLADLMRGSDEKQA